MLELKKIQLLERYNNLLIQNLKKYTKFDNIMSIYLVGGFGRGEGSWLEKNEVLTPLNDLDYLLILKQKDNDIWDFFTFIREELFYETSLDYIDFSIYILDQLEQLPYTMNNFDLKYGSTKIYGKNTIALIPKYDYRKFPSEEGLRLIINRCAGVFTSIYDNNLIKFNDENHQIQYKVYQIVKFLIAIGDTYVILNNKYSTFYNKRKEIFQQGISDNKLNNREYELILKAYEYKLNPNFKQYDYFIKNIDLLVPILEKLLKEYFSLNTLVNLEMSYFKIKKHGDWKNILRRMKYSKDVSLFFKTFYDIKDIVSFNILQDFLKIKLNDKDKKIEKDLYLWSKFCH